MAFDSLTQKGSMGFNNGAPKNQLTQGGPMPVDFSSISAKPSAPADPIYRVSEIGAHAPIGPITED